MSTTISQAQTQLDGNTYFSRAATAWDGREDMQTASAQAYNAIVSHLPQFFAPSQSSLPVYLRPDILEVGCGTGLLSLRLAPHARSLVAVDACAEMIEELKKKIQGSNNILPICAMLEDPEDARLPSADSKHSLCSSRQKFDLAVGHLLLHHVPDMIHFFETIYRCLRPGAWIAFTDFENFGPEARLFHPHSKSSGVERHGIRQDEVVRILERLGYIDVAVDVAWTMRKDVERWPGEWGVEKPEELRAEMRSFPFLMCLAQKPLSQRRDSLL